MGIPIQFFRVALHTQTIDLKENCVMLNLPCGGAARKINTHTVLAAYGYWIYTLGFKSS